jgi:fumarate reductase flavoprotein subunit
VYFDAGFPGCRGDGLRLAQSAGATLRGGERYCPLLGLVMSDETIPSYPSGGDFLKDSVNASAIDRPPWEIWVNSRAERFVREDAPSPQEKEQALRRQPGHSFWMIHDAAMLAANGSPITGWSHEAYAAAFGRNPMCFKAPTLRSLALLAGLDARALSSTVEQYNLAQRRSAADAFGRVHRPSAIESGPFYAVRLQGYTLQSFAGVRVDGRLRVVRDDGSPIPNLYAAGEILGGTAVGSSAYSTGSMATSALTFGRLLGESMIPS